MSKSSRSYKLYYFPVRGRGEMIRLTFLIAGVEFEDFIINFEQWPEFKTCGKCPFGQLPILEIKEEGSSEPILLAQSVAILRFLANEFGLSPETNLERASADMVVDAVMDMRAKTQKFTFEKDPVVKEKLLQEFNDVLPSDLEKLEKLLEANDGGEGLFVGQKLSYADVAFFNFMNNRVAKDKINGYPEQLEKFPLLRALYERVRDIPAVKERLETRPMTDL